MASNNRKSKQPEKRVARAAVRVSRLTEVRSNPALNADDEMRLGIISPTMQLDKAEVYCKLHDLEFDREASIPFRDLDVSGFRKPWRTRAGLVGLYESAKRGEYTDLVWYKLSRMGRRVKDTLDLIEAFEKENIRIHVVNEGFDSGNAGGRMMITILLAVAEMQSEDASQFAKDSILTQANAGKRVGQYLPIWLEKAGDTLVPVEKYVAMMHRIIHLRVEGNGYSKIAAAINREGWQTTTGKEFSNGMIWKYLKPEYIDRMSGWAYLNADYDEDDPERVAIPDVYPRIIDEHTELLIREIQRNYSVHPLRSHIPEAGNWTENMKARRMRPDSPYLLSSVAYCGVCGAKLQTKQRSSSRGRDYYCFASRYSAIDHDIANVNSENLEDAVLRVMRHFLVYPPAAPPAPKSRQRSTRTAFDVQREIDRLANLYSQGVLADQDFQRAYGPLVAERDKLEEVEPAVAQDGASQTLAVMQSKMSSEITRAETKQLVMMLVARVEAFITVPGMTIRAGSESLRHFARVVLKFPDAAGETVYYAPIHRAEYTGKREVYSAQLMGWP